MREKKLSEKRTFQIYLNNVSNNGMKQSSFFAYVCDQFHHVVAAVADDDGYLVLKWKLELNPDFE